LVAVQFAFDRRRRDMLQNEMNTNCPELPMK
jgi:hypothetical protein